MEYFFIKFDESQLSSPFSYRDILHLFGNLQTPFIWSQEGKVEARLWELKISSWKYAQMTSFFASHCIHKFWIYEYFQVGHLKIRRRAVSSTSGTFGLHVENSEKVDVEGQAFDVINTVNLTNVEILNLAPAGASELIP